MSLDHDPIDDAFNRLATLLAQQRAGGHVYMDGSDNPRPTERVAAQDFMEDLLTRGWDPHGDKTQLLVTRLRAVLADCLNCMEEMRGHISEDYADKYYTPVIDYVRVLLGEITSSRTSGAESEQCR